MSTPEKIGYTVALLVALTSIAATMIAPSFMSFENRMNWERAMDDILFGLLGLVGIFIIVVAPILACICCILAVWFGEKP